MSSIRLLTILAVIISNRFCLGVIQQNYPLDYLKGNKSTNYVGNQRPPPNSALTNHAEINQTKATYNNHENRNLSSAQKGDEILNILQPNSEDASLKTHTNVTMGDISKHDVIQDDNGTNFAEGDNASFNQIMGTNVKNDFTVGGDITLNDQTKQDLSVVNNAPITEDNGIDRILNAKSVSGDFSKQSKSSIILSKIFRGENFNNAAHTSSHLMPTNTTHVIELKVSSKQASAQFSNISAHRNYSGNMELKTIGSTDIDAFKPHSLKSNGNSSLAPTIPKPVLNETMGGVLIEIFSAKSKSGRQLDEVNKGHIAMPKASNFSALHKFDIYNKPHGNQSALNLWSRNKTSSSALIKKPPSGNHTLHNLFNQNIRKNKSMDVANISLEVTKIELTKEIAKQEVIHPQVKIHLGESNTSGRALTKKKAFDHDGKKVLLNGKRYGGGGDVIGLMQSVGGLKPVVIKRSRLSVRPDHLGSANNLSIIVSDATVTFPLSTTTASSPKRAANFPANQLGAHTTINVKDITTTEVAPHLSVAEGSLFFSPAGQSTTPIEASLRPSGDRKLQADKFLTTQINLNLTANNTSTIPQSLSALDKYDSEKSECRNCTAKSTIKLPNATAGNKTAHIGSEVAITTLPTPITISSVVDKNVTPLTTSRLQDYQTTDKPDVKTDDNATTNGTVKPTEFPWPVKKEAVVEGDIVLGGLMMVHEREDSVTCGPVMPQGGIQALEAMLYTLDKLNEGPNQLLPNVTLGAHILDDCDKDTYGLEMAVDFIKGSISNIDGAEYSCNKTQVRKVISGVVGAASSVTSIQVANLLRLFKIPQVSFFSTSPELSNKQRFEYFTRTIPSDHYQVKAMVDIIKHMGWTYVSIIYEESNYGIKAFEELEDLLAEYNICIAVKEKLVKDSGVADESAYDNIVQKLLTKPRARGAIIFGSDQEVAGVMRAVRRNNATGSFSWIGSDGWSARSLVSDGNEAEVEGTLSVQPQANPVIGFEEYFLALNVENNKRNPWFIEFWEHHFQCRYPNSSRTPYNQKYTHTCSGKEQLSKQNTVFEDQLQFVSDAVMAFGYAIRDMHQDLCHGRPGLCETMKPTKGTELLKYLRKVDFEGLSGDRFHFDLNGDGPARYNIIHFKQVSPGKYRWIRVGEYIEGELRLNMSEIQFKLGHPKSPESVCSLPCDLGQAKKYVEGESCCWHCFNCTQYQIRHPTDPTQCIGCPLGTVPDPLHVRCVDIPEEYLQPDSGWAIGAMALSSTGILITLFVCGVFIRHNDTPVVRASGRELSYVLLAGILMCYCVTYALVLRPSDIVCGIQRFGAGFCFTVVYAALLTKTNRISRIFNAGKRSAKRPSLISPRSQLIICSGLVGIQLLINAVWMVISPPRAIHHYPTREDNLLVCSSYIDASYMIAFTYPILLIVVCTVYAVLTRKIPEAFNESKHIGFTMYTTCVIWLAFVPLYFGTANHVALRITSMSVTISLSASVTVACLFSPKLYIILIRPERNIRQSMMPMRYSAINKSTTATTNSGAGSMMAAVMVTAATCNQKNQIQKHVPPGDISEKDETIISDKAIPVMIDSSTQTNPASAINNSNNMLNKSDEHLQKVNNNCNGPLAIVQGVQIKDIPL